MNERLRELMVQADYPAPEIALRAQKLAELVVRDCANVCKSMDRGLYKEVDDPTLIDVAVKIKEHFGVSDDDTF